MSGLLAIRAAGVTHAGQVRDNNEDCFLVDADLDLFGVFDGMGGHHAGEVASETAREAVRAAVRAAGAAGRDALDAALQQAAVAVHAEAERRRARRGIGTTAVVCQRTGPQSIAIAHVGDSRAYLLRDGHLQQLTADHTIVAELRARGALTDEEARSHPYRAVLSRNLGAEPAARADFRELELSPGDRVLLCSDGLPGFASEPAIAQTLGGAPDPEAAARDLVELALKGGGGDNVTAVVIEAGRKAVPRRTQIIRTSGATAWWQRREQFLADARARGVARSPICAVLSEAEAIAIVAGNLCEAVFHDLEQTTGIHVWTYAENLAAGWLDQDGQLEPLRRLLDDLAASAAVVVDDISELDEHTGGLLSVAVPRALLVAEMAVANVLASRLRRVEGEIAAREADRARSESISESVTVPMDAPRVDPPPPEVGACLEAALVQAREDARRGERGRAASVAMECIERAHAAAVEHGGHLDGMLVARELFGANAAGDAVAPLFDALDWARTLHAAAVKRTEAGAEVSAAALRRVFVAHRMIAGAAAHVVVDAGRPIADRLREATDTIVALRRRVIDNEQRISRLEARLNTQPGWAPSGPGRQGP